MRRSRKNCLLIAISTAIFGAGFLLTHKKDNFEYIGVAPNLKLKQTNGWGDDSFGHVFKSGIKRVIVLDDPSDGFVFFGRIEIEGKTIIYDQDKDGIDSIAVLDDPNPSRDSNLRLPTDDEIISLNRDILKYSNSLIDRALRQQYENGIPPSRIYE